MSMIILIATLAIILALAPILIILHSYSQSFFLVFLLFLLLLFCKYNLTGIMITIPPTQRLQNPLVKEYTLKYNRNPNKI